MLNFVFKKPPQDKPIQINSRQTIGSYGFKNTYNELAGTLANGKFSYFGYFQYKTGDGWRPNSQFDLHNGYLALNWQVLDRLDLGLEVTRMHYLAQQPGGLTDVWFEEDARQSVRERNWFTVDWNLLALTADYRLSDFTRIDVRTFALAASRQALGILSPVNVTDFGQNRDLIDGSFHNVGGEVRLLHRYHLGNRDHSFVAGVRVYQGHSESRQGEGNDSTGPDFYFLHPEKIEKSDYTFRIPTMLFLRSTSSTSERNGA